MDNKYGIYLKIHEINETFSSLILSLLATWCMGSIVMIDCTDYTVYA